MPDADVDDRARLHRMLLILFGVIALVYAASPVVTNFDSYPVFPTAVSIVHRRTLSLDEYRDTRAVTSNYSVVRQNGQLLTYFPWSTAVFAVPGVVVVDAVHALGGDSADDAVRTNDTVEDLVQMWSASLVTAFGCTVLAFLAYRRLPGSARRRRRLAAGCGLVMAFGTTAWSTASRALWQHGPALLTLALGLLALDVVTSRSRADDHRVTWPAVGAGAAFAMAFTIRPSNAIVLALAGVLLLWRDRSAVIRYIAGALAVLLPWLVVTRVTYGTWLQRYDAANRLRLRSTIPEALLANLVSPSRGLLVFSPICLLAVGGLVVALRRRSIDSLLLVSLAVIPIYWIASSSSLQWWAGHSFGPRYMSETLPFLFVLALPFVAWLAAGFLDATAGQGRRSALWLGAASLTVVLCVWSVFVHAQGGVLRATKCWNADATRVNVDEDPERIWSLSDPQFVAGVRAIPDVGLHDAMIGDCPA